MSAARQEHPMSVAEYFALENANIDVRYEYLDGQIFMMSGGSVNHAAISANIIAFLLQALREASCLVLTSDARVKLNDARYVYPDVTVKCGSQLQNEAQHVTEPTVVVEVLSPGTEAYDRGRKLRDYRTCPSLMSIILVAQDQAAIDVYRRQSADIWTVQTYGITENIVLESLNVQIPVAEVYRRITFVADEVDS